MSNTLTPDELTLAQATVASLTAALAAYDAASNHFARQDALSQMRVALTQPVRDLAQRLFAEQRTALVASANTAFAPFYTDQGHRDDAVANCDAMVQIGSQGSMIGGTAERAAAKAVKGFFAVAIAG